ncbi:hypothetical protein KKD81_01705 [Patescibacteria group bacterium]|nr:hypothetical protein [Patescibacteria group bacterium]MBU2158838.1 hypothetical protein [Patescibacteria group bacterium]MBU2220634.1 hypothetical protein [Patescibacteria group bacterium]
MTKQKNIKEYVRTLSRITLGEDTHARMRISLSEYADLHQVPAEATVPQTSAVSIFSYLRTRTAAVSAFVLVLVVATGTQATLASEKALPGDLLYPIKVAVREPIELALAPRGEAKAEVATRFASVRVEEVSTLMARGKLDSKTSRSLANRFDSHVAVIDTEATAIEATGKVSTALAVRTLAEADLTLQTEELSKESGDQEFREHAVEKTKSFGVERARLASALSVMIASSTELADVHVSDETAATLMLSADSSNQETTSTSTASSTPKESEGQRIFKSLFFKEKTEADTSLQFMKNSGGNW